VINGRIIGDDQNLASAFGVDLNNCYQEECSSSDDNDDYSLAPFGIAATALVADDASVVGVADDWLLPVVGIAAGVTYFAKQSGKDKSNDVPSWARGNRPNPGENGNDFADRLCDEKYGPSNYPKGPGTEHNKIRKWGDRGFK